SFSNSRSLIKYIYRWYKILSPKIEVDIHSIGLCIHLRLEHESETKQDKRGSSVALTEKSAFDKKAMLLYVTMHQTFSIQYIPFHCAYVGLTTVLHLTTDPQPLPLHPPNRRHKLDTSFPRLDNRPRYYIQSQNDLYQTDEFVKFVLPWLSIGPALVMIWQICATVLCVIGAVAFYPITWLSENVWGGNQERGIKNYLVGTD
ncbi:hypothetical protein LTR66_011772, partial [Elasticomyces elasticus]